MGHLGHTWEDVLRGGGEGPPGLGRHPWDKPHPIILDMTAAAGLGYIPAGDYATTVAAEVDWLDTAARDGKDAALIPRPRDGYFDPLLDYPAEDRRLATRMASAG